MRLSISDQRPSTSVDSLAVLSRHSHEEQSHPTIHQGSRTENSTHSQDVSSLLVDVPLPEDFVETHTMAFDEDITTPENDAVNHFIKTSSI